MAKKGVTRRKLLATAAGMGSFAIVGRARAVAPYKPSDSLLNAARREGKFVSYRLASPFAAELLEDVAGE